MIEFWRHWYEVVETGALLQGDVFQNLRVAWLPQDLQLDDLAAGHVARISTSVTDCAVISASCDLARGADAYPQVLVATVVPAESILGTTVKEKRQRREVLRQDLDPGRFLLAEYPEIDPPLELSVVQFRQHFVLPMAYLTRACGRPRLRLRSPFREKFGAWVGRAISRVGIEDEMQIPREPNVGTSLSALLELAEEPPSAQER